jgi:hypothetical protein
MSITNTAKQHIKKVQPKKGLLKEPGVCKPS